MLSNWTIILALFGGVHAVLALDLSLLFQVLGRICSTPNRFRMGAECLSTSLNTPATSENHVTARSEPVTQRSKKLKKGIKDGEVMSVLQEITGVLNTLVKRVESTEKEIKGVKIKLESSSKNSSTSDVNSYVM